MLGKSKKLDRWADYFDNLLKKNVYLQSNEDLLDPKIHVVEITLLLDDPLLTQTKYCHQNTEEK